MSLEKAGLKIWRSYEAKLNNNTPEEQWEEKDEFSKGVRDLIKRGVDANLKRKSFLTLMGASLSMVAANCSRKPVEKIVPYFNRPMNHVPGVAEYYATARVTSGGVAPVLVKVKEGKPRKIEGLASHPVYKGAVSGDTIATIWDLYDPDRIQQPLKKANGSNAKAKWEEVYAEIKPLLSKKTLYIGRSTLSPFEQKVRTEFASATGSDSLIYDSVGTQKEIANGAELAFGKAMIPRFAISKASLILSIDADFLGTWISPELFTKEFSAGRTPDKKMNRLIVAESNLTVTGSNADTRYPIHNGSQYAFAMAIAKELLPGSKLAGNAALKTKLSSFSAEAVEKKTGISAAEIKKTAKELKANKGKSLVLGGSINARTEKSGELAAAAFLINELLENNGKTVVFENPFRDSVDFTSNSQVAKIQKALNSGKYETVIIDHANLVHDMPAAFDLSKAKSVIYIGTHMNETADKAAYVLPANHYLESWSDGLSYGTYSVVQPAIRTLFDTREASRILMELNDNTTTVMEAVQQSAESNTGKSWKKLLSEGYASANQPAKGMKFSAPAFTSMKKAEQKFVLSLYQSVQIGDGTGANISFRQELPDPISKVTWDNYLAVSVADAKAKGWKSGNFVKVSTKAGNLTLPVYIQPGLKQGTLAAAIGYGFEKLGKVGAKVGKNVLSLAEFKNGDIITAGIPATIEAASKEYKLVTTQRHHELAIERGLVRQATLEDYLKDPKSGHEHEEIPHHGKAKGLYKKHEYTPNKWNLAIDLNKCTGCSACVVSCYSENNVPAVGKDEIDVGAEMSWLRIDRYYGYSEHETEKHDENMENPDVFFQPLMCQHCDNAPCENVCPVGATAHSDDGLNYMTYNQCIGTRYCANDCPYKVRRFNWFENWEGKLRDPEQYALSPDVTVRSQGVIEKCSMCQQRISEKRQQAHVEGRELKDGEVLTACQQACPADAIVFGDINDEKSAVSKQANDPRAYKILAAINVEPVISYMVKIKNKA